MLSAGIALPRAAALSLAFALAVWLGATNGARPVHAAPQPVIEVDTTKDGKLDSGASHCVSTAAGGCSLRAAIELNNQQGTGDEAIVELARGAHYDLTIDELKIERSVRIMTAAGPTPAPATVTGDGKDRVFDLVVGAAKVTIADLVITGGNALRGDGAGGGIRNLSTLTLAAVQLDHNVARFGGAIADFGTLAMIRVVITHNEAHAQVVDGTAPGGVGGGVAEYGILDANQAELDGNSADEFGGDIAVDFAVLPEGEVAKHGSATVNESLIETGLATEGGGTWVNDGESAVFTNTTFLLNNASSPPDSGPGVGGGVANRCGTLTLINDTLDGNSSNGGLGGGIAQVCGETGAGKDANHPNVEASMVSQSKARSAVKSNRSATASLDFVTVAENFGGRSPHLELLGGGIATDGDASTVTVHNTIVANTVRGNTGGNCAAFASARITSLGYNLEDANDCGFNKTGDQVSANPLLGPLARNGGARPTLTMALPADSPAVDRADPNCDVTSDERGFARPQGPRCDIGAFELVPPISPVPPSPPAPPMTGRAAQVATPSAAAKAGDLLLLLLIALGGLALALQRIRA